MVHFARENFAKKYAKNIPRKNLRHEDLNQGYRLS